MDARLAGAVRSILGERVTNRYCDFQFLANEFLERKNWSMKRLKRGVRGCCARWESSVVVLVVVHILGSGLSNWICRGELLLDTVFIFVN